MRKLIIAALLAGGLATPAFAQDDTAAAAYSGFRVEGIAGYDRVHVTGGHSDGITYGAGVGYDFQSGGAVFGIEGEAADSSTDDCVTGVTVATDRLCAQIGRDLYVGGRVGALVGGRTLVYAKAGYANTRVGLDYEDGTAGTASDFNVHNNLDGVRVGAGVEFPLGTNAYAKAEYRYSNYEQGFDRHQGVVGFGFRF